ncbi:MAG TPA: Rieske 2Fe-2S domain-containing protein [Vicinamibacterales bacterium]
MIPDRLRLTRRRLFQGAGAVIASALAVAFRSMANRVNEVGSRSRRIVIPPGSAADIVFVEDVIVCRTPGGIRAFSARCPHLGCVITKQVDGEFVCPCHGSRFRLDGSVEAGPAIRPLEPLRHSFDEATGAIVVQG